MTPEEEVIELEKRTAAINALPDSSFAYVDPEGGKHFPIHDASHVRNALARLNQSPHGKKALPKIIAAAHRFGIQLDPEKYKKADAKIESIIKFMPLGDAPGNLFYGIVYEPDEIDTQGDFATAETIEKAAHNFLPNAVMNLHHSEDLKDVQVVESYIINPEILKKAKAGAWILVTRVLNPELKKAILDGEITGYSLEGSAIRMEV